MRQPLDFCREGFMIKWFFHLDETIRSATEVACVGVLGTREQRSALHLQFLGWPEKVEDLDKYRGKLDRTARCLYHIPTGEIKKSGSYFRSAKTSSDLSEKQVVAPRHSSTDNVDEENNEKVFRAAAEGKPVAIGDVFNCFVAAILCHEDAMLPRKYTLTGVISSVLFIVFLPSFLRLFAGHGFLGNGWQSQIIIVCLWPSALTGYLTTFLFVWTGIKDFWRLWALMRSCSALLSLNDSVRFGCPPEVYRLPPLDLNDIRSIEAWNKLRRLCREWGLGYFERVRGFASIIFVMTVLAIGDTVFCMHSKHYMQENDFNLAHLILVGFVGGLFVAYIIAMVILGQDINDAAAKQVMLLSRQKLLLTYGRYERAISAADKGEPAPEPDTTKANLLCAYIEAVQDDLKTEAQVNPVRLLGYYCGYSLLSALYSIPILVITSIVNFCSGADADRCVTLI
jgi:hypothetical protein